MGEIAAVVLGGLLIASFATLGFYAVLAVTFSLSTLRRARRARQLADDLDRTIVEVLGPRSPVDKATQPPVTRL